MRNIIRSIKDGFMWAEIDRRLALSLFVSTSVDVYKIDIEHGSECLISTIEDLTEARKQGHILCIELCFEKDILDML